MNIKMRREDKRDEKRVGEYHIQKGWSYTIVSPLFIEENIRMH